MPATADLLRPADVDRVLAGFGYEPSTAAGLHDALLALKAVGLDATPLPGRGRTLQRWQLLAAVAARDVALVKLVEGHLDALAIMAELGATAPEPGTTWGTWAAEPPDAQVAADPTIGSTGLLLTGRKAWCSGAGVLSHGLLTCRGPQGERWLAAVALHQPGVFVEPGGWNAVGMAATRSVGIRFEGASATLVGGDGDYLQRMGFWQGGAGIAACWWGGARGVADVLLAQVGAHVAGEPRTADPHAAAHLGAVVSALGETAALLREAAQAFDAQPGRTGRPASAEFWARLTRASAEATASVVLERVGRATGAAPLCLDGRHARLVADLTVFVRQSHAERDLAQLGLMAVDADLEL